MKTHQEIREAIQAAPLSGSESIQLYKILHALNDRIEKQGTQLEEWIQSMSASHARRIMALERLTQNARTSSGMPSQKH